MVEDLDLLDYEDIKDKRLDNYKLLLCLYKVIENYDIELFKDEILFISKKSINSLDVLLSSFNTFNNSYDMYYLETYTYDDNKVIIDKEKEYKYSSRRVYN